MKVTFSDRAWEDYINWQNEDKKTLRKINALIKDTRRNGVRGIGHPEQLSEDLAGWWSKEIDEKNRLVFRIVGETVDVLACRSHYRDK